MKKVFQRLLTFFIGLPVCFSIVWFFTFKNHLLLNFVVLAVSFIGCFEVYNMLSQKVKTHPKQVVLTLSCIIPLCGMCCAFFSLHKEYITYSFIFTVFFILIYEIFSKKTVEENTFMHSIERICSSTFVLFYVPLLLSFVQRMAMWNYSKENIVLFLLMVFLCDSFAWLFGITMGKGNRGFIKVSPNKSLVGFFGGFIGAILIGLVVQKMFPNVFGYEIYKIVLLGFLTALAGILGDLAESILKRSSGLKDSGFIIPGRGGIMDSIDSILLAAPVYYIIASLLFNFA